jgi:histidinol-phosphate aminotransferase
MKRPATKFPSRSQVGRKRLSLRCIMSEVKPGWIEQLIAPHILSIPAYVPGKPVAELVRELGIADAVKMASNENPLGPSPLAISAMSKHLVEAHIYPESSGPDLRAAIGEKLGVDPDQVILGNGSDEIMTMVAHVFIKPGCEAIMGSNAFSMYRIVVEAFGGARVPAPLVNYAYDLEAIADAVNEKTRLIFIAVPHSPTGTIVTRRDFERFLKRLPERMILIIDEAYREYVDDDDCPNGLDYLSDSIPVLVLRTFSKIYGLAGLRIGYGIGPKWLIEILNRVRAPFNANSLAQVAAEAALRDDEHVSKSKALAREGIEFLSRELGLLGFKVIPSQANFVAFCAGKNAKRIYEALLKYGVIVRHLASFGMDDCIRVTVGTAEQNSRFIAALKNLPDGDDAVKS